MKKLTARELAQKASLWKGRGANPYRKELERRFLASLERGWR